MSVSLPKGYASAAGPAKPTKVPATSTKQGSKKGPAHHHAAIGAALKAGDHKLAMHHTGHLLMALKSSGPAMSGSRPGATGVSTTMDEAEPIGAYDTANGDDEGMESSALPVATEKPSTKAAPNSPPSKGKSAMFAKLRSRPGM